MKILDDLAGSRQMVFVIVPGAPEVFVPRTQKRILISFGMLSMPTKV